MKNYIDMAADPMSAGSMTNLGLQFTTSEDTRNCAIITVNVPLNCGLS